MGLQHLGVASLARGELGLRLGDAGLGHLHLLRRVRVEPVPVLRAVVAAHLVKQRRARVRVRVRVRVGVRVRVRARDRVRARVRLGLRLRVRVRVRVRAAGRHLWRHEGEG